VLSSFSVDTWRNQIAESGYTLGTVPTRDAAFMLAVMVPFLLPALLMNLVGLVAIWKRRHNPQVVGSFAAFISPDIVELVNQGASRHVWQLERLIGTAGAIGLVANCRRDVPSSSWWLISLLALAVVLNRWQPFVFLVVVVQATWVLLLSAKERRRSEDHSPGVEEGGGS
jgi:hypothetical protein